MKTKLSSIIVLLSLFSLSCASQKVSYTATEKSCITKFNEFTNYINDCIKSKINVTDSTQLNYVLSRFLFVNTTVDSTKFRTVTYSDLTASQLNNLKSELKTFYRFLQERQERSIIENMKVIPFRLSKETGILKMLTSYQKKNSYVFFDRRNPDHPYGYILFISGNSNSSGREKIWSWTLVYKFGKFIFKSVTGEEGYEYIFSK